MRETILDRGHDGVRLHHRQDSRRPRVADATVLKAGLSDGGKVKDGVIETKKLRRGSGEERGTHEETKCREKVS